VRRTTRTRKKIQWNFVHCVQKLFTNVMEAKDDRSIGRFCLQRTDLQWGFLQFLQEIISNVTELMPKLSYTRWTVKVPQWITQTCRQRIILIYRGDQIFHKSRSCFKIPGAWKLMWSQLHSEDWHSSKFSLSGDLAVGICAPLLISTKVPEWTKFCITKCSNFN
jgi:hypothetical protein